MDFFNVVSVAVVALAAPWNSSVGPYVFLYLGPETVMPVASILAAIVGVIVLFWNFFVGKARRLFRLSQADDQISDASLSDDSTPLDTDGHGSQDEALPGQP